MDKKKQEEGQVKEGVAKGNTEEVGMIKGCRGSLWEVVGERKQCEKEQTTRQERRRRGKQ